jgi:beta-barrel assembly-enhancing protease
LRGSRSILREIAVILAVAVVLGFAAFGFQRLILPRRAVPSDLAKQLDEGLGSLVKEQVLAEMKVVDAARVKDDFALIAARLHDSLPEPRIRFEVIVLQSPEINSFTLPGGTICVDTGLIRALGSADEMAGVLGHELSHAVNRDPLNLLVKRIGVAALLGALSGGRGGNILANTAQTLTDLHYGREAEDRADAFSVGLIARAGISPGAFADALQSIKDSDPKEPGLLKYLDPHSPIDQRISRARDLARRETFTPRPLKIDWDALVKALPGR